MDTEIHKSRQICPGETLSASILVSRMPLNGLAISQSLYCSNLLNVKEVFKSVWIKSNMDIKKAAILKKFSMKSSYKEEVMQ